MRPLLALMMLIGALAALMTGAAPASAMTDASSAPPCHEMALSHADPEAPSPAPAKSMKSMECCVACVAAPVLAPPGRARLEAPPPAIGFAPASLPTGERPAPEPHPPRRLPD